LAPHVPSIRNNEFARTPDHFNRNQRDLIEAFYLSINLSVIFTPCDLIDDIGVYTYLSGRHQTIWFFPENAGDFAEDS